MLNTLFTPLTASPAIFDEQFDVLRQSIHLDLHFQIVFGGIQFSQPVQQLSRFQKLIFDLKEAIFHGFEGLTGRLCRKVLRMASTFFFRFLQIRFENFT